MSEPANNTSDAAQSDVTAIRYVTFWRDGFQVEGGDLMRYDDSTNAQLLAEIQAGRAPLALLGVHPDQRVELRTTNRFNESFTPDKSLLLPEMEVAWKSEKQGDKA